MNPLESELLALNQRLLNSIAEKDWLTYSELCDPTLTAFEPEAAGQLGRRPRLPRVLFQTPQDRRRTPIHRGLPADSHPGRRRVIACTRLIQKLDAAGKPKQKRQRNTRLQKQNGAWKHVHFHRSPA